MATGQGTVRGVATVVVVDAEQSVVGTVNEGTVTGGTVTWGTVTWGSALGRFDESGGAWPVDDDFGGPEATPDVEVVEPRPPGPPELFTLPVGDDDCVPAAVELVAPDPEPTDEGWLLDGDESA
jgi:hypothetical protein